MFSRTESGWRGKIDWVLLGSLAGLVLIGSIVVVSAASPLPYYTQTVQRHFLALFVGWLALLFGVGFNYQIFQDQWKALYGLTLAAMIAVFLMGDTIRGHRAWIRFPFFTFQPSEFARVCMVLILAHYLDRRAPKIELFSSVMGAFAVVGPILGLILLEPDYSTTVAFFPVLLAMLFCAGARIAHILLVAGYACVIGGCLLLWTLLFMRPEIVAGFPVARYVLEISWFGLPLLLTVIGLFAAAYLVYRAGETMLIHIPRSYPLVTALVLSAGLCTATAINSNIKDYQRNRFLAYLSPESYPQEAAYNVNQALVAIGSGGLFGKGIFSGTQSRLGFLPERHTDFIYAVVGEEWGFVGAMMVLGLYLVLLWRTFSTAKLSRDRYGYFVCVGIASMMGSYLLVNVGMCLGLVPVAGIPLPLVSYGGSSLVISMWSLGVVLNVYSKRYAFI